MREWSRRYHWSRLFVLLTGLALATGLIPTRGQVATGDVGGTGVGLPSTPALWPSPVVELGMADGAGGAAALRESTPFGFRYQYLAGGVNTGQGWATWSASGQFVTEYVEESVRNGVTPVFTYYMIAQSAPGRAQGEAGVFANLQDPDTMKAYWEDLELFFRRAGATGATIVLHVEPDLWGFAQQESGDDDAASTPVRVASSGAPELAGLPNTVAGFAQAVIALRDEYAPNVILGYHLSTWGTGYDLAHSDPADAVVDTLANRAACFYLSLEAEFDVVFAEFSDRDAAFKQYQYHDGGGSWWTAADFGRNVRFLARFVTQTQKRVVMWQIPLGNTKMQALNNTWNHYQDNRVEWLLGEPERMHLKAYVDAGVIAFLFGRGADGATCACDANKDGVTNPSPINGNASPSLSADDDGGFFDARAGEYYTIGAVPFPEGGLASDAHQSFSTGVARATD